MTVMIVISTIDKDQPRAKRHRWLDWG